MYLLATKNTFECNNPSVYAVIFIV